MLGGDRSTAASVEIAEAAAPQKRIPIFPRNGELSEMAASGNRGIRLSGPGKGRLGAGGTIWEKILCSEGSTGGERGVYSGPLEGQKIIPAEFGFGMQEVTCNCAGDTLIDKNLDRTSTEN